MVNHFVNNLDSIKAGNDQLSKVSADTIKSLIVAAQDKGGSAMSYGEAVIAVVTSKNPGAFLEDVLGKGQEAHIDAAKEIGAELGKHVSRLLAEADASVTTDGPSKGGGRRR